MSNTLKQTTSVIKENLETIKKLNNDLRKLRRSIEDTASIYYFDSHEKILTTSVITINYICREMYNLQKELQTSLEELKPQQDK